MQSPICLPSGLNSPLGSLTKSIKHLHYATITHQTEPVHLDLVSGNHRESVTFVTFSVSKTPWLARHNPHTDWSKGRVQSWSLFCLAHYLKSALPPALNSPQTEPEPKPDLSSVPLAYHDLHEVFNKDKTLFLPLHRLYDCAIDLLPGAPLPPSCKD